MSCRFSVLVCALLVLAGCSDGSRGQRPAKTANTQNATKGESLARVDRSAAAAKSPNFSVEKPLYESAPMVHDPEMNTESYSRIDENAFQQVKDNPRSTFSIDVDTASYANVRRMLKQGSLPPADAVRIEELLNYFTYRYAPPTDAAPFAVHTEVATCPWDDAHRLVRIGIKGKELAADKRPPSNLVFLIDVSGSMDSPNKLPLVKRAIGMLIDQLGENDRVGVVVYAGAAGMVLDSTPGSDKSTLHEAIEMLEPGGSTAGAEGIELAYKLAQSHFNKTGNNRVILCTDGDFNVGVSSEGELTRLIEAKAKSGIFLTVLGFGMGNYKDATLEKLADRGNGNYAYIDNPNEAHKVFVEQIAGTLVTIAKDVKIQVEFNPTQVAGYRLVGYENRLLKTEDFNDDKKDAGEIGAGHTVTALYEVVPAGQKVDGASVDPLKYQKPVALADAAQSGELLTLRLRFKKPTADKSELMESIVRDAGTKFSAATPDFQFAAAVAEFGMLLRDSKFKGSANYDAAIELAMPGLNLDPNGHRAEFVELVRQAKGLQPKMAQR